MRSGQFESQKKFADSLIDVSEATVINILKWKPEADPGISNEMWRSVGFQVDWRKKANQFVETQNAQTLILYYMLAQDYGEMFCVVGLQGRGKTFTAEWFSARTRNRNVFMVKCKEVLNKKYFLIEILRSMGKRYEGMNLYELWQSIIYEVSRLENPLFIFDEIDKLPDNILSFFIQLYNELRFNCGFVLQGQPRFRERVKKGIEKGRAGYRELFSRFGSAYIELPNPSEKEVREICRANGITDAEEINRAVNESHGDLRRIDRVLIKSETAKYEQQIIRRMKSLVA